MNNKEKYLKAFCEALNITPEQTEGLVYTGISEWDSVGHMNLIASLEETFDIMMDTDDIIDLSSFEKGMEILKEKYDVEF
ncbi:MAG: acyl carrier protein [Clostridiales bacterium]|nr:acyl carrier protein [Clostridiales bacterium]